MLKKILFWIYVGIQIFDIGYMIVLLAAEEWAWAQMLQTDTGAVSVLNRVLMIYTFLYYLYRVFYLYRGTEERGKWTMITVAAIAGGCLETIPMVGMILSFAAVILVLAGIVHDYGIVTTPEAMNGKGGEG